ncbi:MAG: phospho-N-acetylmuramoyl-pentapeptide-transferase, partial [Leptospiraceae bacterium]|nr:phospho-N-acetylmuramoyl-pentapeptide-transferase [Leptospiraceae bacterium]
MFEYLYSHFDMPGFFRLFGYVSFRALLAGLFSMTISFLVGEPVIRWLTGLKFRETIRDDGPSSHAAKAGTPTMGGLLILLSLTIACLLFGNFSNLHFNLILICTLALGGIGFWDDYSKVVLKKKGGMSARTKMVLTIIVAAFFIYMYFSFTPAEVARKEGINYGTTDLFLPFVKGPVWVMPVILAIGFWLCVILGTVHGVNLTDGLDGLAIGNVSIVTVTFGLLAYLTGSPKLADYLNIPVVTGAHEISVFLAALAGAGIGFLWFNAAPARIFMGDT